MSVRVGFIGNLVVFFAALFATIQRNYSDVLNLNISPGLVGLSISYALQINQCLNFVLQTACILETNIIAVERVQEYSEIATEAPTVIDDHQPPDNWPSQGHVKFDHYSTRYREGLNLVLKDINLDIPAGTKVYSECISIHTDLPPPPPTPTTHTQINTPSPDKLATKLPVSINLLP